MYIQSIDYVLGNHSVDIASLCQQGELSREESMVYTQVFGLRKVKRSHKENYIQFLKKLLIRFTKNQDMNPAKINYVMLAHTADFIAPYGSTCLSTLVEQWGFVNAQFFASSAYNCVTLFLFFQLCEELFKNLAVNDQILVLTGDLTYTPILKSIPGSTVMSDTAAAVLLTQQMNSHRYICCQIDTYGQYAKGIWDSQESQLHFQSHYVFYLMEVITKAVKKAGLLLTEIALVLPHNVNLFSWSLLAKRLSIKIDKIYLDNISQYAHAFGADPIINLKDAINKKRINPGDYYMLVSVGLGAAFAAAIFQY